MKLTSAEAAKLLRKYNDEIENLISRENLGKEFLASVGEDTESVRPVYSYEETREALDALNTKIRKLKHALNIFNSTQLIPEFNMTIDEMLIYLPQLTERRFKLNNMKNRLPKIRENAMRNTAIIDYRYTNYDIAAVAADFAAVSDELSRAQNALDKINSSVYFEVDEL